MRTNVKHALSRASLLVAAWAALGPAPLTAQSRTPIISAIDVGAGPSPVPVTIAGRRHLAYELQITNVRPSAITLTRIQVVDAVRGTLIGDFSDAALSERLAGAGAPLDDADKRVVNPGRRTVVYLWLPLDTAAPIPSRLQHRIAVEVMRTSRREQVLVSGAAVDVRRERPIVLSPPLRGGPWVALYDPMLIGGHRTAVYAVDGRARIPARFAIDWVRVEADGTHARGDRSRIENWYGYAAEVLAVADGTVVEAHDDVTEAPTLESPAPIPLENVSGNYVALDLGGGRFAFYEHLKHGSLRVKRGDRLKRGQVLGLLGNSGGSSSGPHLHFHVADAGDELAAEGLPFVFESFSVLGAFGTIGAFRTGEPWKPVQSGAGGERQNELPSPNAVVMFPASTIAPDSKRR
jgi:murein DD-endopeptidase